MIQYDYKLTARLFNTKTHPINLHVSCTQVMKHEPKHVDSLNFQVRSSMVAGNLMIPLMRHIGQVPVTTCTLESPDLMKLVLRDSTLSCHRGLLCFFVEGRCPSQRFTCYVMLSNRSGHEFCHFNVCFFCEHDCYSFSSTVVRYGKNLGACIWEAKNAGVVPDRNPVEVKLCVICLFVFLMRHCVKGEIFSISTGL